MQKETQDQALIDLFFVFFPKPQKERLQSP